MLQWMAKSIITLAQLSLLTLVLSVYYLLCKLMYFIHINSIWNVVTGIINE